MKLFAEILGKYNYVYMEANIETNIIGVIGIVMLKT